VNTILLSSDTQPVSTDKERGAFFTPVSEWVIPVKKWLDDE
jgi:hypothetical protein